jgi:hypothetical protein
MIGTRAVTELTEPKGALLLNFGRFPGGCESALERIPSGMPGVYAWFRSFDYSSDPDKLYEQLMMDLRAPKFLERVGPIKPFYEVSIRSQSWFSPGKLESLKSAVRDPSFRRGLMETLSQSILLQAPLYIGKSVDLQSRTASHLAEGSILRLRLAEANVALDRTVLFLIPNPEGTPKAVAEVEFGDEEGEDLSASSLDSETRHETAHELIYEEIYSRLFNPLFTIRIG